MLETIYLQDVAWAERAIKKLLATENYVILVAELDDQIVGFIDYYILSSIWEKWNEATINNFFIHKDYQGAGKGSRLLEEVIKRTDDIGIVELHVGTKEKRRSDTFIQEARLSRGIFVVRTGEKYSSKRSINVEV